VSGDVALYADWGDGYQISFNSQGGLNPNPTTITVGYGVEYGALATTARVGHTFLGWYTQPDGKGSEVFTDTLVGINADHTLYAKWQANTQTITFDVQFGTSPELASIEVTYGTSIDFLPIPMREHYTFKGWWTGIDGTGSEILVGDSFDLLVDTTLYAYWVFSVYEGPAGGLVFYENPDYEQDGWRYLEAAPYGWFDGDADSKGAYNGEDDPFFQWGACNYSVTPTSRETKIGSGLQNSINIVNYHDSLWTLYPEKGDYYTHGPIYYSSMLGENDGFVAAKICLDLEITKDEITYCDWFLPSRDELTKMWETLHKNELGGFKERYYYSSSEYNNYTIYQQLFYFDREYITNIHKFGVSNQGAAVRPVRAF
jgi:uncharacterized repeat protein (TIGR02543 family)